MKTALFILCLTTGLWAFGGIIPKVEQIYKVFKQDYPDCVVIWNFVPYEKFPFWCEDGISESDSGQVLKYTQISDTTKITLHGLIMKDKVVRVVVCSFIQRKVIKSKVYRMFFFKKNSKGKWYHHRPAIKTPLIMKKGGTCG